MRVSFTKLFCALALLTMAGPADASVVSVDGLHNTGVDDGGVKLLDGVVDPHYTIAAGPAIYTPNAPNAYTYADASVDKITGATGAYPNSWVLNAADSQWIGPDPDVLVPEDTDWDGAFDYTLSIDLGALDPASVIISGLWASDNGSTILLNGNPTGNSKGSNGYGSLDPFTITGFLAGPNVITFRVTNDFADFLTPNPSGLQVSQVQANTPEPVTIFVWLGLAVTGLGCGYLKRSKSSNA